MNRGRHTRRRRVRGVAIIAIVLLSLSAVAGAGAYAAYRYEQIRADRILPGITIAGVDVSGMSREQARRAVARQARQTLEQELTVAVGDRTWTTSAAALGRTAAVRDAVERALAISAQMGTFDRFWHRVRHEPLGVSIDLAYGEELPGLEALVAQIARAVRVQPRSATIGLEEDATALRFVTPKAGSRLASRQATEAIAGALADGREYLELHPRPVPAAVTPATLGPTIVVWVNRNMLELYDGFEVEQTWSVATAKPGYTTPTGVWNIWDKRENPTWYNPALDSWGADLPAVVPGGPGNPMGTRAIYIDAPGLIRIHGTTDPSSIGRYASHGCIRMRNEEIEDLFERIPVGAHVIVAGFRPAGASYWDTPGAADI